MISKAVLVDGLNHIQNGLDNLSKSYWPSVDELMRNVWVVVDKAETDVASITIKEQSVFENAAKQCVLKVWVMSMPWKLQSILISGLRAPDAYTIATKKICRWMRAVTQNNADPSKGYMEPQVLSNDLINQCMDELEYLPCHYVHHFADSLRVIALYCPEEAYALFADKVHTLVAEEIFHFKPETDTEFTHRHRDMVVHL